jgi:hypothetical protein
MLSIRWRLGIIFALTMTAFYFAAPTFVYFSLPKKDRNNPEVLAKHLPN